MSGGELEQVRVLAVEAQAQADAARRLSDRARRAMVVCMAAAAASVVLFVAVVGVRGAQVPGRIAPGTPSQTWCAKMRDEGLAYPCDWDSNDIPVLAWYYYAQGMDTGDAYRKARAQVRAQARQDR